MRRALFWVGAVLCAIGLTVFGTSVVMTYLGRSPSLNLGDPARFQFILVPFWQIGLGLAVLGAICLWLARRLKAA